MDLKMINMKDLSQALAAAGIFTSISQEENFLTIFKNLSTSPEVIEEQQIHESQNISTLAILSKKLKNHGPHLMESSHWNLRLRNFYYAYHHILYATKISTIPKQNISIGMVEEDIQNDPDEQVNQGHHNYIEIWFQTIMEHHYFHQKFFTSSQSKQLFSHILVYIKAYISNPHMSLFVILLRTWLHWKYSYT